MSTKENVNVENPGNIYGTIYVKTESSKVVMTGGTVDGSPSANVKQRCVNVVNGASFEMYGGTLQNGHSAANNGGCLLALGNVAIYGGTITGGSAVNGGNIYMSGGGTISNCVISGGTADSNGENIRVDGGTVTLTNVTVTAADSENEKDYNISVGNANTVFTLNGGTITGGYEAIRFGAGTSFTLDGIVEISSTGRELYLAKDKVLTLGANFSNAGSNRIRATKADLASPWDGSVVTFATGAKAADATAFAGGANGSACIVFNPVTNELEFVGSTAAVEGNTIGYATLQEAINAANGKAVLLHKDITETGLTLNADTYIDLYSYSIRNAIEDEGYALNIYDSTNRNYVGTPGSYAGTNATEFFTVDKEVSGADTLRRYLNIENDDGTYSPHRVYLSVTAVSINPGQMKLNYKSMFIGDAAVKAYVEQEGYEYGLKFQVGENTPVYANYDNGFTAYTDKKADSYTQKLTGVQISEEAHTGYGVKATAYIAKKVAGELVEIATSATTDAFSFKQLVVNADQSSDVGENVKTALYNMYTNNAYMANWGLQNITGWAPVEE